MASLTLKQLRAFVLIADYLSITRAAEEMHQTQPSVTVLLKQLEDALGTKLFERTTRKVAITPAGLRFLPQARQTLQSLAMAVIDLRADRPSKHESKHSTEEMHS